MFQRPRLSAIARPTVSVPSVTSTKLPGSAKPENRGAGIFVTESMNGHVSGVIPKLLGASGEIVSTTDLKDGDRTDSLPARSVAVAVYT